MVGTPSGEGRRRRRGFQVLTRFTLPAASSRGRRGQIRGRSEADPRADPPWRPPADPPWRPPASSALGVSMCQSFWVLVDEIMSDCKDFMSDGEESVLLMDPGEDGLCWAEKELGCNDTNGESLATANNDSFNFILLVRRWQGDTLFVEPF